MTDGNCPARCGSTRERAFESRHRRSNALAETGGLQIDAKRLQYVLQSFDLRRFGRTGARPAARRLRLQALHDGAEHLLA